MNGKRFDIPEDITAQVLTFDPVLPPEGTPDALVRDEDGSVWLQILAPNAKSVAI